MTPRTVEPGGSALRWVAELLGNARIRFLVAGEAAAAAHGAAPPRVACGAVLPAPAGVEVFVAAADLPRVLPPAGGGGAHPPRRPRGGRRGRRWPCRGSSGRRRST